MEYLGAELCFIWNFQGQSKKVKNLRWVFKKLYILMASVWIFPGIAQYTDDRMGNAPNILGHKEQKESQPLFIFYCKLSKVSLVAWLLIMISELRTNLKYVFNIPFRINLKTIIMGTCSQFHDGAQLKFYPHLAQKYYTSRLVSSRNLCQGLELPFKQ